MDYHDEQAECVEPDGIATKRIWIKPAIEDFAPVTIARGSVGAGAGDGFSNAS